MLKLRLRDASDVALKVASVVDKEGRSCNGSSPVDTGAQTVDVQLGMADIKDVMFNCSSITKLFANYRFCYTI